MYAVTKAGDLDTPSPPSNPMLAGPSRETLDISEAGNMHLVDH